MITIHDAFTDAWRSYRIAEGDDAATLPDPLGTKRSSKQSSSTSRNKKQEAEQLDASSDAGGGFIVDGEDEEEEEEHQSTASPASSDDEDANQHRFIPVSYIPDALATLRLDSTDAFVLGLFAEVAISIKDAFGGRRRVRGAANDGPTERVIGLHDFERVAEVLLDGRNGVEEMEKPTSSRTSRAKEVTKKKAPPVPSTSQSSRPRRSAAQYSKGRYHDAVEEQSADGSESAAEADAYQISDDDEGDAADGASSEEEKKENPPRRRISVKLKRGGGAAAEPSGLQQRKSASGGLRRATKRARATPSEDESEEDSSAYEDDDDDDDQSGTPRRGRRQRVGPTAMQSSGDEVLSARQSKQAKAAFSLLMQRLHRLKGDDASTSRANRIGKADVRLLVKSVGEKMSEREMEEMIDEGIHFFAKASSASATRASSKRAREAAAGQATAQGRQNDTVTIGLDEFAGILKSGHLI